MERSLFVLTSVPARVDIIVVGPPAAVMVAVEEAEGMYVP